MDNNTNNWKEFTLGNPQEEQPRRVAKSSKRKPLLALLIVAALYLLMVVFFSHLVSKLERRLRSSDH